MTTPTTPATPGPAGRATTARPEAAGAVPEGLRRLRLDLAYDGGPFSGFARQPGRRTVQGDLEAALERLAGQPVATVGAGRTDAGVHARGQVVHADVPGRLDPERVRRSLNGQLGPAVVVAAAGWAPPGFDAHFSASARRYAYRIDDGPAPDPLARGHVMTWPRRLDLDRMRAAAAPLVGEHDFATFCRAREGATTVRRIRAIDVDRRKDASRSSRPGLLVVELSATAFCHQMVRCIVGLLIEAGDGKRDPASVPEVLAARDRRRLGLIAPPHGLVLEGVEYAGAEG
jgi:tRNA pseudouridine38-40 synthase